MPASPAPPPRTDARDAARRDRRASIPELLGLSDDHREQMIGVQAMRLAHVGAVWPFTVAAQMLACVTALIGVVQTRVHALVPTVGIYAAVVALVATLVFAASRGPGLRDWPVHYRNRILMLSATALSAALLSLLWTTTYMPVGPWQLGCFVAVAGAIGVTASTIHPVRAATLGFGGGLVATLALLSGIGLPLGIAIAFLGCLAIATHRLARIDHNGVIDQADAASEGRLAVKMIAEFEGHGTGWFWEADRNGRVTYISAKVAGELVGAAGDPPVGRLLTDLLRMDGASPGTERTLAFHLSSRTSFTDYTVCAAGDGGSERWWSISGRPVIDELGRFQGFIGSGSDLTEKRRSEAEITRLALFDGLTGLANRDRIRLSLDKILTQQAGPYRATALFLLDLDRFKAVNDTLGHQAGDALLKQVAQRLQRGVGDAGLVGRIGGDEFQVVLPGMNKREALSTLARDLIASLSHPYHVSGASVAIGCSIGIAITPDHGEDSETLIRNADLALYAAKADGRGLHRFYSDEMLAGARSRQELEDDLRIAVTEGAFHLCYQPVVNITTTRIVAYEALIRWQHPTRGLVSPADFIPLAEECGLIEAIGEWVLRTACDEAARWPGDVRIAVNVSPIQFANPVLPSLVTSALARSGIAPDRLELEITEGVFLDETASSDGMFKALKAIGVRLSLDDFGTGYSSLGYLRTAPFDKIKIDQSFVKGAAQPGNRNAAIIKAIVTLADTLGMETTAEGVEIQDEVELIRSLGCTHIQGYVYGRPERAEIVHQQLGMQAGVAVANGFKVSRVPRTKMLRSARIAIDGVRGDVRIRDISPGGAMIDGIAVDGDAVGLEMMIELLEDQMVRARVRWAKDGRAGIEFAEPFNLDRLNPAQLSRAIRRMG